MIASRLLRLIVLAAGLALATGTAPAEPMKVPGMQTVYQRVLTKHGTPRSPQPGAASDAAYNAFLPLYVFARKDGWVQIGAQANAAPEGWVPADKTIEWRQNIVAAFTNPANRQRQVILDTEPQLTGLLAHENPPGMLETLVRAADADQLDSGSGVVAVEPATHIDLDTNFYIMPILGFFEDFHPQAMSDNLLLNVASLPLQDQAVQAAANPDVGIVLVVDTTMSMQPYFGYTRDALQAVVQQLGTDATAATHFGIVTFQDTGMAGHIKVALPLERRGSVQPVLEALETLREATQSSPGYNEDSLAAVNYAMDRIDWAPGGEAFGMRYIVLVTDAGPKLPTNDRSAYHLEAADLRADANDQGFGLVALHIQPSRFAGNHDFARAQYQDLTRFEGTSNYFGVSGEDPAAFRALAQRLARFMANAPNREMGRPLSDDDRDTPPSLLGLDAALRLRYLGSVQGTQAPDVITGWISQYAVEDARREAVEFRLLITRNQLATLADLTQGLIDAAEQLSQDEDVQGFHRQIRELIVQLSQNPERVVNPSAQAPGDALEFLQDLPYRSRVLRTTEARWMENPGERREIIDGLYSKLAAYKRRLTSRDIWHDLFETTSATGQVTPGSPDGDHVTTIPIQFLP